MSNEIVVNQVTRTTGNNQAFKAPYLIVVQIKKGSKNFICLEKPDFFAGHVTTKGFFCDSSDEEISEKFSEILNNISREVYVEVSFPLTKIEYVKNLVYKAKS